MKDRKPPERGRTEELIAALEREQSEARDSAAGTRKM